MNENTEIIEECEYSQAKRIDDYEIKILSKMDCKAMLKQNIECCVCFEFCEGVKLPNCNHFICTICYYKIYNGFISDKFYNNNPIPKSPPKKPKYPYLNNRQNLEIHNGLTQYDTDMKWFTDENEDLYNCVKTNSEYVNEVDINIKKWFENNDLITKYENDLLQYELQYEINYKKYSDEMDIYLSLWEQEREHNIKNSCPLCRL